MTEPESGSEPLPSTPPASPPASPPNSPSLPTPPNSDTGREWERDLLNRLAFASLVEQRRARRWNIAFKFAIAAYLVFILLASMSFDFFSSASGGPHTALIDLRGVISDESDASADRMVGGLRAAFEDSDTAGVILRINSPGGSPVQAGYINDEISRLRTEYPEIKLYAVITDMAASGGYYVAAAADEIYANESSVVGSIGVLMNGFGFVEAMDKLGIERRLLTAGENKGFLDPFSPLQAGEVDHIQTLLEAIHEQFIQVVRAGRGDRLVAGEELFSGLVWTGTQSLEMGLVDGIGSSSYVARTVIGAEEIVDFTPRKSYLDTLAERLGASLMHTLATELGIGGLRPRQ